MSNREPSRTDILQGTLDSMVLQTLESLGPQHGRGIASGIEQVSRGVLQLNMGTAPSGPDASRTARAPQGAWGKTETNRRARFYSLTAVERRQLVKEKQAWDRMPSIIHTLIRGDA